MNKMVAELALDASNYERGLKSAAGATDKFGSSAAGALGKVGKTAFLGAAAGAGALGAAVAVTGFKFDNMRQQAQIAFTTMLGSGAKAEKFLDKLAKFAASTPFEFPELVQTSQKLMAMGFAAKDVVPMMTAIGDSVAGLGAGPEVMNQITKALGQMHAKGKAASGEMMQLAEAGIPAFQMLADKMGITVPEVMKKIEKGLIDADTATSAVIEGMNARFGGMMEKQSHTFGGLLSTLKDTFQQVSGKVMEPFFDLATAGMQKVVDFMSGPSFDNAVKAVGNGFEKIGSTLKTVFDAALPKIKEVGSTLISAFQQAWPTIQNVLSSLLSLAGTVASSVQSFWNAAGGSIMSILRSLGEIGVAAFNALRKVIEDNKPQLTEIAARVAKIADALVTVLKPIVILLFEQVLPRAIKLSITAIDLITTAIEGVIDGFTWMKGKVDEVWTWMKSSALKTALAVVEPFSHIPGKGGQWARDLKDKWNAQLELMKQESERKALETSAKITAAVGSGLTTITTTLGPQATTAGQTLGGNIASGMSSGIFGSIPLAVTAAQSLARQTLDAAAAEAQSKSPSLVAMGLGKDIVLGYILGFDQVDLPEKLKEKVRNALDAARAVVSEKQQVVADAFSRVGEYAARAFQAATDKMLAAVDAKWDARIAKWQKFSEALTPAEKKLQQLDASEAERQRAQASAEAQAQLAKAQAMDEGVAKEEAVAAALEAIRQADLANTRAALETKAAEERAKREEMAQEHIKKLEEAKTRESTNLEERRRIQGEKLQAQLTQLQTYLAKHPDEYDKVQKKIVKLLNGYGVEMKTAGENLGVAFAAGLIAAEKAVGRAAEGLAKVIAQYLKTHSPTEKGPMSDLDKWWVPFGETLVSSLKIRDFLEKVLGKELGKGAMRAPTRYTYAKVDRASSLRVLDRNLAYRPDATIAPASSGGSGPPVTVQIGPVYGSFDRQGADRLAETLAEPVRAALLRRKRSNIDLGLS